MVQKVHPVFQNVARSFMGKSIAFFNIDFNVDIDGSVDPDEAVDSVLKVLSIRSTIVFHSAITGSGELLTVGLEAHHPDDNWGADTSRTFEAVLQADIRALGTVDSLDLSGTVVTAGVTYYADQINV